MECLLKQATGSGLRRGWTQHVSVSAWMNTQFMSRTGGGPAKGKENAVIHELDKENKKIID